MTVALRVNIRQCCGCANDEEITQYRRLKTQVDRTCDAWIVQASGGEDVGVAPAVRDVVHGRVGLHAVVVLLLGRVAPLLPL